MDRSKHKEMIEWKKSARVDFIPLPGDLYLRLLSVLGEHFMGFDFMTVPAPSFHTYDHYPIWDLAQQVSKDIDIPLLNLFPEKSGKTKMMQFGSCQKQVQEIECLPEKFVLILDDLYTTGLTMRVTCEAIAKKGSFPCGIAIA